MLAAAVVGSVTQMHCDRLNPQNSRYEMRDIVMLARIGPEGQQRTLLLGG
jgi:hypothetical protein